MSQPDDIVDTRLSTLLRNQANRLESAAGFTKAELVDAALAEAMSVASGTLEQVRLRLLGLVDEALMGPSHVELPEPPPGASEDERRAYAEALHAQGAALLAEADALERLFAEAKRRGLGPGAPVSSVFAKEELETMPPGQRWGLRAPRQP